VGARALVVSHLNRGNLHLPASDSYLGATKAHPRQIPFVVHARSPRPDLIVVAGRAHGGRPPPTSG
jgi:hypothetical protein